MGNTRKKKQNDGFTLVELIVVIVIILILSALLVPSITRYVQKSRLAKCANQRHELATQFELLGADEIDIGVCESDVELTALLGGKLAVDYLVEKGYCSNDITTCPVYNSKYQISISTQDGHREVEFICPCVDSIKGYLELSKHYYTITGNSPNQDRKKALEALLENGNSYLKVSDNMKKNTYFADKDLSWLPYHLSDGKMALYASTYKAGSSNAWSNWDCYLLYVDGKVYQSTKKNGNKPTNINIADLSKVSSDSLSDYLASKGLEEVS